MSLEKQVIELIATDRIEIPISSISGKLKRKKPKLAREIALSCPRRFKGERTYAEIKTEDKEFEREKLETEEISPAEELEAAPKFLFEEIPNPHLGIRCETCHREKPTPTSKEKEIHTLANNYKQLIRFQNFT